MVDAGSVAKGSEGGFLGPDLAGRSAGNLSVSEKKHSSGISSA